MRTAETILGIIQERGTRGLPLEDIYRQLYNPDLYLRAYARLYSNKGAMTKGSTTETADAMTLKKIKKIIEALRQERYRWTPLRRTFIPKKNGKKRPLSMPTWTDKLLQEVIRLVLEAYYEPHMSDHSHGFRPRRGCHTALNEIQRTWTGTKWFIEGDITGCFDHIDHESLLSILGEKLHDQRFLRLIRGLLKTGYLEAWRYHRTFSGTPQGGVVSPILANIYLQKLDEFVEQELLPSYNRGKERKMNPPSRRLAGRVHRLKQQGKTKEAALLRKQMHHLPSANPNDPDYRRLKYVRYADDVLLGFVGPLAEARTIKERLKTFLLTHLKLELNEEKTLITHAQSRAAHFLGYEITTQQSNEKRHPRTGYRNLNGAIALRVPAAVIEQTSAIYLHQRKPTYRPELLNESDYTIVQRYQWKYRGLMQYYALAVNIAWFRRLHRVMEVSLLKTLAHKHKQSVRRLVKQYQKTIETPYGKMKCLEVRVEREGKKPQIAQFGGLPWRRQERSILFDSTTMPVVIPRNEVVKRLLRQGCELCGSRQNISVHQIRTMRELQNGEGQDQPMWVRKMATMRRKTLVVCGDCHHAIHTGKPAHKPHQGK